MSVLPRGTGKRVTIVVGHHEPTTRRVLQTLREEGAGEALVMRSIAALGLLGNVETVRLADVVPDLPSVILWIDTAARVERILPLIEPLITDGIITVDDVEIVRVATSVVPDLPPHVPVGDIMTRDVITVAPDTPMADLVALLIRRRLHAIPVVQDGQVVGIVTIGDLFLKGGLPVPPEIAATFDTPAFHQELAHLTQPQPDVAAVMTTPVTTVQPHTDVRDAAALMCERGLLRLPVADAEGALVGIVARADLLRVVAGGAGERPLPRPIHPGADGLTPVRDIMILDPPAVAYNAPLRAIVDAVLSTRLHRAIVVGGDGHVVGLVSDAELVCRLTPSLHPSRLNALMHHLPFMHGDAGEEDMWRLTTGKSARDLMLPDAVIAAEDEPIREVLAAVIRNERQVVPVVDDSERLIGVVDRVDLLSVLVGSAA
ncbi:MAG TPA: DUF190 domain-containing protein [Chloroflexota bacterium]|nr:DUF190 domain-containing protein [Chloroflexota bacterium]